MAPRSPLVLGGDGLLQQLQAGDSIADALGFSQSFATSGYQRLPSGLIIQWGQAAPSSGTATITFPLAFPNACLGLCSDPTVSGVGTGVLHASFNLTISKTGATIAVRMQSGLTTAASTAPVMWQALGY